MTLHEKITAAVALILLLAGGIGFAYHWWVNDWRYWFGGLFAGLSRTLPPLDLPGPDTDPRAGGLAGLPGSAAHDAAVRTSDGAGEFRDEWEQLDPDQAAAQLIAEWHGEGDRYRRCWYPELHTKTLHGANIDCPVPDHWSGDVWDQWWNGVDGLERECLLVHDWLVREERLWAELKAETRELCAA